MREKLTVEQYRRQRLDDKCIQCGADVGSIGASHSWREGMDNDGYIRIYRICDRCLSAQQKSE